MSTPTDKNSASWADFDAAYKAACESSKPEDWMQAALMAQQIRYTVSAALPSEPPCQTCKTTFDCIQHGSCLAQSATSASVGAMREALAGVANYRMWCRCSLKEIDSGHHVDCHMIEFVALQEWARSALDEHDRAATTDRGSA